MVVSPALTLENLNHYLFSGKEHFQSGFRVFSEYGLLVVFRIMHCRVMLFGFTIPNHVSTSRVLLSGTHYALITRTTIVSIMYCY